MASFYARNGAGDLLARYSFIEPLLEGKRVLELGAARATGGGSALFLAERGAAAVLSLEPSEEDLGPARDAGHHPFVQFRSGAPRDLRQGTFDLVLVAGGAALAEVAGGPPEDDVPPYEGVISALSDHFPLVEVATQSATVGWVLALTADGEEPEIAMDGTLAGTPETAAYVVICGDEPCGLSGLQVTALPVKPLVEAAAAAHGARQASADTERLLEAMRAERDEACRQLDARADALVQAVAERDEAAVARDAARAERELALQGRETARAERDDAISSREAALAQLAETRAAREGGQGELEEARAARETAEASLERLRADAGLLAERTRELEALLEAEREAAFEARAALDRAQAGEVDRAREAEQARRDLQTA